ncbi:ABC transporter permease [Sulfitobacter porphyrae]|uniref:ABC transporter permease n=1 Tax=Sulfitobacter porphyrae TaxID=1246864 RepID=A0ABW2B8F9_9RHOB
MLAARVMGIPSRTILRRHILPNIFRPNLVLATVGLGTAILLEATLSFLGAGVPSTTPSLGTLIRVGSTNLFSGEWWVVLFPGLLLIVIVFAINIFGDWLGDALNPRIGGRHA